jgi:hypothetical protein
MAVRDAVKRNSEMALNPMEFYCAHISGTRNNVPGYCTVYIYFWKGWFIRHVPAGH